MKRIFILGAGFSKPAGLPLGSELLQEIEAYIDDSSQIFLGHKDIVKRAISNYQEFSQQNINEINIEDLIEFIDYRNFLGMTGSLSDRSQSTIRVLISIILNKKQQSISNEELYKKFVSQLSPDDIIITLNYDTILESFLNKQGIKYKLFPPYLCKERLNYPCVPGINLLKVHGSINWFDHNEYLERMKQDRLRNDISFSGPASDFVFNNQHDKLELNPVIPLNFEPLINTSLSDIYWISDSDLDRYTEAYNDPHGRTINHFPPAITNPVILSPSYTKLLYSHSIKDLFYGASFYGRDIDKIILIGCSMTNSDSYIRQCLFYILRQYYGMYNNKKNILIINKASNRKQKRELKRNYSFIGKNRMDLELGGFTEETLSTIFET